MPETNSLRKQESVVKLEKVLNLWKSKNNVAKFTKPLTKKVSDDNIMFLGRKLSKKLILPNSVEDITITSQRLCEEYIEARLTRSGIKEFNYSRTTQSEEYLNVVQNMGQILEMKYPRLYSKISVHLKLTYTSEIVVWDSFNKFGTHLFAEGITWAKIIAFYAFTGGLALDCMTHGKNDLPGRIVYWFGVFVLKKLATWIQKQGGWNAIVEHFNADPFDYDMDEEREEEIQSNEYFKYMIKHAINISFFLFGLFLCYLFSFLVN